MLEGLDGTKATAQPESTYKVRHMKMGFKVTAAMCTCDSEVALKVLVCTSTYLSLKFLVLASTNTGQGCNIFKFELRREKTCFCICENKGLVQLCRLSLSLLAFCLSLSLLSLISALQAIYCCSFETYCSTLTISTNQEK